MSGDFSYGPIVRWPGRLRDAADRVGSPFKSSHDKTVKLLRAELAAVAAESAVVQLAMGARNFNDDGTFSRRAADTGPAHPGVIVSFSKPILLQHEKAPRKVPLSFPCDRFDRWRDNLRAIALALEALRKVDRYGVTSTGEQYTGFKALPGPLSAMPTMSIDEAATFIAAQAAPLVERSTDPELRLKAKAYGAAGVLKDPEAAQLVYRLAAKRLHPDGREHSAELWAKLQQAIQLVDAHHRGGSDSHLVI